MVRKTRQSTRGLRSHSREGQSYPAVSSYDIDLKVTRNRQGALSKVGAGILLLLSIWFLFTMFGDQRFRVSQVTVQGTRCVSEAEALGALTEVNGSIFRVNPSHAEEILTNTFGCLERAQVTCKLPDQIQVVMQPQDDLLIWESGGNAWWVNHYGRVVCQAKHYENEVVIEDMAGITTTLGVVITEVPWDLALDMAEAMPNAQSYLYMADRGLVIRVTDKGWPVYLGRQGNAWAKAEILRALTRQLVSEGADIKHIDLRCERQATFKR